MRVDWRQARGVFMADWGAGVARLRDLLRSSDLHLALWLCLPALLVGAAIRIHFCAEAPYGYFLSDTRNFIDGARNFLKSPLGVFGGGARTFLAPILYSVPVGLDVPLLRVVPWGQHAIGLGMIVASGLLCAAWFRGWRWWIVPVTLVVAAHPTILWYEHMALPESMFVALTMAAALAVALFLRIPSPPTLLLLLSCIFLTAGARQEGFLYSLAALVACAVVFWRDRRRMAWYAGGVCLFLLLTARASQTTQGGQMLIASVIQFAPDRLWLAPDYSGRAAALRERFAPLWPKYPAQHNESRDIIKEDAMAFLRESRGMSEAEAKLASDAFCKRVGLEIALRRWWELPRMAYCKWLATHLEEPSPYFHDDWPREYAMNKAFGKEDSKERRYLRRFLGTPYDSADAFARDLERIYYPVDGLGGLGEWQRGFLRWSLWPQGAADVGRGEVTGVAVEGASEAVGPSAGPDEEGEEGPQAVAEAVAQKVPVLPWLYPLGLAGLAGAACVADGRRRKALLIWLGMLLFMGFATAVVGSLRSRYRLSFEPYWYFGLAGLLETCRVFALAALWRLRQGREG